MFDFSNPAAELRRIVEVITKIAMVLWIIAGFVTMLVMFMSGEDELILVGLLMPFAGFLQAWLTKVASLLILVICKMGQENSEILAQVHTIAEQIPNVGQITTQRSTSTAKTSRFDSEELPEL